MAKQTVGSSTDRWQRPSSSGSGLLPPPASHIQLTVSTSTSGLVAGASGTPHPHPQPHQHQNQYPRKKGPGSAVSQQQQQHQGGGGRDEVMSPPGMGGDRSLDRAKGRTGGQGHQGTASGEVLPGSIVHQHDLDTLESCSRNPLLCLICNNIYEDPRLLSCYHSFCAKCLPGRMGDTKLICPLCGKLTTLKDNSGPPTDHLLRFLLHTSSDIHPLCANCDNKKRAPMYYCNTCGQVLCNGCREETHRAKMFSAHDIIPVSKYTKETTKKCSVHGEQYIMFSNVQKSMLCINCYRDTAMESRLHCVDLETAYSLTKQKVDRAVMSLRDLQVAVRDGITMLKTVLEELRRNSDSEKSAVNAVCQTILDALTKTQENLLRDVDCQMEGKDKVIRGQLSQLRSVLPTIKLHLAMCATIANATNKYDFLDLAYPLIDRLTAITHMGYPIRPGQSSQIKSTYKAEIARTLEPWIAGAQQTTASSSSGLLGAAASTVTNASVASTSSHIQKDYAHPSVNLASVDPAFGEPTYSQYYPMSRSTVTPLMGHKTNTGLVGGGYAAPAGIGAGPSGRKTPVSVGQPKSKGNGPDEHFAAHCRSFSAHFNELSQRLNRLKEQVQELHRDVTLQRGTSHSTRAENALREGLFLEDQLERRYAEMERIRKHLESYWNENLRQIRMEQEVFQSQMTELISMKSEVKQLSNLLQQLQSFLKSLSVHHQQLQPGGGSGGPGGSGGSGGGGSGGGGTGQITGPSGSGQGMPQQISGGTSQPHRQQQVTHDNKSYHMSPAPDAFSRRTESASQVTPSLGEMAFSDVSKGGGGAALGPGLKSDLSRLSGRSLAAQSQLPSSFAPLTTTSTGGSSAKHQFQAHQSQPGYPPRTYQQKQGKQTEMEYIQVDTSYPQSQHKAGAAGRPIPISAIGNVSEASMKKGVLSQLIDKVRSKDDRKKSSASGVSSSSSGGTIPQPPVLPSASALAARRALTMYDAQCQYGLESSTSAVSALALANSNFSGRSGTTQRHDSRPIYTRAKSFVSKSDDERPPSKLSKQLRARSAGQLETESLLRSLSSGSKDASRILSLYQSLSKSLIERENQQMHHQQQRQSYPQTYNQYSDRKPQDSEQRGERRTGTSASGSSMTTKGPGNVNTFPPSHHSVQSNSLGRVHSVSKTSTSRSAPDSGKYSRRGDHEESLTASEDDYQQIPVMRCHSIARSHSAPPRKPISSSAEGGSTEVKVFVHDEPRRNGRSEPRSTRSSPSATLSKSLEESYLYGYLSQHHSGVLTSSSSGQSGFGGVSAFTTTTSKKPVSCESLISLGDQNSNGHSRKSSIDFDRRSVVTVRRAGSKSALITRQHSWEAGAQLTSKREQSLSTPHLSPSDDDPFGSGRSSPQSGTVDGASSSVIRRSRIYDDEDLVVGNTLHKADSFEGHEEAVRSIVAAVQETRTLQRRLQSN